MKSKPRFSLFLLLLATRTVCCAWVPPPRRPRLAHHNRLPSTRLHLVGNAYLNSLERQTQKAAASTITATTTRVAVERPMDTVQPTATGNAIMKPAVTMDIPRITVRESIAPPVGSSPTASSSSMTATLRHDRNNATTPPVPTINTATTTNTSNDDTSKEAPSWKDAKKLMQQIKDAGTAGIISFALVQLGFWSLSLVAALVAYVQLTGHWPDWTDPEEMSKLGAETFAYINIARLAAPLRIAFALSSTSWIQSNVVDRFSSKDKKEEDAPSTGR